MNDANCLVIVEVRYRTSRSYLPAHLTVNYPKQQKLIRTAAMLLRRLPDWQNRPMRFDVVGVDVTDDGTTINWVRDAFRPGHGSF